MTGNSGRMQTAKLKAEQSTAHQEKARCTARRQAPGEGRAPRGRHGTRVPLTRTHGHHGAAVDPAYPSAGTTYPASGVVGRRRPHQRGSGGPRGARRGRPVAKGPGGGRRTWRPCAGRRTALLRRHRRVGAAAWRRSGEYTGERVDVTRA